MTTLLKYVKKEVPFECKKNCSRNYKIKKKSLP